MEDFNDAIRLKASYVYAYNNRAAAKFKLKDYKGAEADCNKALILKNNYPAKLLIFQFNNFRIKII